MKDKILEIINIIRISKELQPLKDIKSTDSLRDDIEFTSFDLAELTVRIEDGLVSTVGEVYAKLIK